PGVVAAAARALEARAKVETAAAAQDWQRYDELKLAEVAIDQELNRSSETAVTSDQVTAAVTSQIEAFARDGRPWFVFAHFFDAHCDYVPPPPYDTRFDPDYTGAATGKECLSGEWVGGPDPSRPGGFIRAIGDRDLDHVIALYEGEVAWVDAHVGAIMHALEASGLAEKTLVIVVSDDVEVDAAAHVTIRDVMVQDAFRRGAIKITRTRMWPQFPAGVAPDVKAAFQAEAAAQYAREEVRWIDVQRAPGEPGDGHSMRFTDPSVRAALDAFRREYTELATLRRRHTSPLPLNVRLKLVSLGSVSRGSGPSFPEPD